MHGYSNYIYELGQFVRIHPEVQALQLTDDEWSTLQQVAKILKPFWDHTISVSKACPTIVESLPIYWSLDDLLNDVRNAEGDFDDVNIEIRDAVERGIRKMNKFARIMDDNLLYYVASVLDPRIKSSLIVSQMSEQDSGLIISQVREFLKKEYPPEPFVSCEVDHPRPAGMSETMWRTLRKVQPCKEASLSDIDKYLDSPPVNWSHHMIGDADAEWVLKWWKANAFNFSLMAKAARDYLPIPSAEVGIEREFSNARDVLGLRRHRLNAETMRWLMLLAAMFANQQSVFFQWATLPTPSAIQIYGPKVLNGPTRIRLGFSSFIRVRTTRIAPAFRKRRIKRGGRRARQRIRLLRLRRVFGVPRWERLRRVRASCFTGRFLRLLRR